MVLRVLVNELKATVLDLVREAADGDEGARRWLVESFPGHTDFLLESWYDVDERPASGAKVANVKNRQFDRPPAAGCACAPGQADN
jgi:hypothetical protein